jgi:hypothetical protein
MKPSNPSIYEYKGEIHILVEHSLSESLFSFLQGRKLDPDRPKQAVWIVHTPDTDDMLIRSGTKLSIEKACDEWLKTLQ